MDGSFIEDLTMDTLRQSNKEIKKAYLFPSPGSSPKADRQLASALQPYDLYNLTS